MTKRIRLDTFYQRRYVVNGAPWGANIWRGRELIGKGHGTTERLAIAAARDSMRQRRARP